MNENDKQIDEAAQANDDHDSMVESTVDRQIFDEITQNHRDIVEAVRLEMKQPAVTDFTEIVASITQDGLYAVRVLLDSGIRVVVSPWVGREEAERLELAISQSMIEYHTKRNAWESKVPVAEIHDKNAVDDLVADKDDGACPDLECSGGVVDGICSHCDDEWAWKEVENS